MAALDDTFEQYRSLLFAIAYRMLGSVQEAEDAVQEAYLRYQTAPVDEIRSHKAYLTTVITRLCIDQLKSAREQRQTYIGPWLPEPLRTSPDAEPDALSALNDSLSTAMLVLLETLNPVERAVFVLHDVFDYDYAAIALVVGRSETTCRQILHRARTAVRSGRPRFDSTPDEHHTIFQRFIQACSVGDLTGLETMLSADVTVWSDGGGKASAARRPVEGVQAVSAFMLGLIRRMPADSAVALEPINGRTGLVLREGGVITTVMTADVAGGRITALRFIRNPDKLRHLQGT